MGHRWSNEDEKGKWKRWTDEELLWFWFSSLNSMLLGTKRKKKQNPKITNNHQQVNKICLPSTSFYFDLLHSCVHWPPVHRLGLVARVTLLRDRAFLTTQRFLQHAGLWGGRHCQSVKKSFSRHSTADKNMGEFFHPQELACDWQLMKRLCENYWSNMYSMWQSVPLCCAEIIQALGTFHRNHYILSLFFFSC